MRFQFGTSSENENNYGGRRYSPYVYTEQGIAMLAGVLHSDIAVQVSIRIMNTFVEMRRFIANNALMFEKINRLELKQLETDEKFDRVFKYLDGNSETSQKIFFEGQIYDALSILVKLIQKTKKELILIDGYVDVTTFQYAVPRFNRKTNFCVSR